MATRKAARTTRGNRSIRKTPSRRNGVPSQARARPSLPYTTRPSALRRFLEQVPTRPRPQRINAELLASWGLGGGENNTIIRVLKAVGLVNSSNEPTEQYTAFMRAGSGPAVLGALVRNTYAPLFGASLEPHREPAESLRNLFNIHSSGASGTIDFQIQTFKALCDYSSFENADHIGSVALQSTVPNSPVGGQQQHVAGSQGQGHATLHIDLHIHLPEGRTSREYEYIIQDIARFIYGRDVASSERDGRG